MRSKVLVISTIVLLLLVGLVSQAFAAGANTSSALLRRTSTRTATRTATKLVTLTPTPTSALSPVTGSVLIHGGGCCMGGPVGTTISIDTAFSASSTAGAVTEMRIGHQACSPTPPNLSAVAWEPFLTSKNFSYTISAINWVGYYVDVQYRDAAGNVSPVYCDDISIEGMPGITGTAQTGTPTALTPTKTRTPTPSPTRTPTLPTGT